MSTDWPDPFVPTGEHTRANWGFCNKVAMFAPLGDGRFYVIDGSGYLAKMGTREDFGCTEHEPGTEP